MLDEAFKKGRKFIGIPLAILLVAVIALSTGGVALAAYLTQTAQVPVTVNDPLTFDWSAGNWVVDEETGEPTWEVMLYACETAFNTVMVSNAASVDVPLGIQADTTNLIQGVECIVNVWYDGEPVTYVPAGQTVIVDVMVTAACDIDLSQGPAHTAWVLHFLRGY
jgi:hypothetical protein